MIHGRAPSPEPALFTLRLISTNPPTPPATGSTAKPYLWLWTLILGYIGLYLCRKNLSVAIPLIQKDWHVTRADLGVTASVSTLAYAVGKFFFGPIVDRFGGGRCFIGSLFMVGVFAALGATSGSIPMLTFFYSCNRFAGAASWGSMVKLAPDWFPERMLPMAMGLLSLGFVFGGVCATMLAGRIAAMTGNNWRAVMGGPAIVLFLILVAAWFILPKSAFASPKKGAAGGASFSMGQIPQLLGNRQFWVVCALSFTLTLMRETFNTWTVDFFKTEAPGDVSTQVAAFLSTPFDAFGALGIMGIGWLFGRITQRARKLLLFCALTVLSGLILSLTALVKFDLWAVSAALCLVGFLTYGPYSLLAGILSVEIRGKEYVATVAGAVDGFGYLASIFAGRPFGRIVDKGGYVMGFRWLAVVTLVSAVLCLFLYSKKNETKTA